MNLTDSIELLRDYADRGDEAAFRELVERYIDLVHSAAVRRVGDDDLARDITQKVFSDLARKARALRNVEYLGGWLHRHTGFTAASFARSEKRRQIREQAAVHMNALNDSHEVLWQQLAPALDETIEGLDAPDRQAVLLRFFERRDFRAIGLALGISDDAAQKRVSRALEKLRDLLARRGVTLSLAILGTLMAGKVLKAAPAGQAAEVARHALAGAAAGSGAALMFTKLTDSALFKGALGAICVALAAWFFLQTRSTPTHRSGAGGSSIASLTTASDVSSNRTPPPAATQIDGLKKANAADKMLLLKIVTVDGAQPIPDVQLDYWVWEHGKVEHKKPLQANRFGVCEVPVPDGTTELCLVSQKDGFADTLLDWRPDRGEIIPADYTLRLARGVPIGGRVLDPEGNPIAGAQVGFNNQPDPGSATRPQSDDFSWPFWVTTTSDAQGRWRIDRIGKEAIRSIYGSASHPAYQDTPLVSPGRDPHARNQLLANAWVFTLGRAVTIRGVVVDSTGQPVPDAKILVGHLAESGARETNNEMDGAFSVSGCKPGQNTITARAKGYAPATLQVDLTNDSPPIQITLSRGKVLKLKVVDGDGDPVPHANVWLDTFYWGSPDPAVQFDFNRQTDANGRLEWDNAPDQRLIFQVTAAGKMRSGEVAMQPDGSEHVITLQPALTISGTVSDATTGKPIPRFRIVTGWPNWNPVDNTTNVQWSTLDRFWLSFAGGQYHYTYEEPPVGGTTDAVFVFKFEADGYAPFVTGAVPARKHDVHFDVALNPASATEVTVLAPDGKPAADTDVGLISTGGRLFLVPGGFSHENLQSGGSLLSTDAQGHFQLIPDPAILQVVAAGPQGYAAVTRLELATEPVMRLQPWGRLEGTYLRDGQPVSGAELQFQSDRRTREAISCDFNSFRTKTDRAGRFGFPKVPTGNHQVILLIPGADQAGREYWMEQPLQKVSIQSGETKTITIGGSD